MNVYELEAIMTSYWELNRHLNLSCGCVAAGNCSEQLWELCHHNWSSTEIAEDLFNSTRNDLITSPIVQAIFYLVYITIFVLGVFGNVLVCFVVARNKAMHTVTNLFITNLALSDILLCVLAVPFTPLYSFVGEYIFLLKLV